MSEEPIEVSVKVTQLVRPIVVAKIAEEFADWLEREGFSITYASGLHAGDERSYEELSKDFTRSTGGTIS